MTVYARSDLCYVAISRDHGGCGEGHGRPVVGGAPVRVWALNCLGGCEDFLRSDPLWAVTSATVPETPDETSIREDVEKRGQVEQASATAAALRDLAKLGDLPTAIAHLASIMSGQLPQISPAASVPDLLCRNGHRNTATAAFCGACGTSLKEPVPADRGKALETSSEPEGGTPPAAAPVDLDAMSITELRDLAKSIGAKTARSKEDQIAAIREVQQ